MNKLDASGWQVPEYKVQEFFKKRTKYCVMTPVINEGEKIKKQLQRMKLFAKQADIILVDGGSTDGSVEPKFVAQQGVRAMLTSPSSQSVQLRCGLSWALRQGYEGVITIDGNGKDDVSAIPDFVKSLDAGYDYTQSSRFISGGHHENTPNYRLFWARYVISPLLSLAAGYWYTDTPNAFRGYSRRYLLHPEVQPFRDIFKRYELLFYLTPRAHQLGLKTQEIPVTRVYPKGQIPTKIVGWKRIYDMLNIFKIALGLYNPR